MVIQSEIQTKRAKLKAWKIFVSKVLTKGLIPERERNIVTIIGP